MPETKVCHAGAQPTRFKSKHVSAFKASPVSLFWVCSLPCRYEDERFENASVEFDEAALAPTYRCLLASVLLF